jgi:hypothetical protein
MKNTSIKLFAAAFILVLMPPAFAKTISKEFTESVTVERTIVAVKKAERLATLRDDAGNTRTVSVSEAFQNWDRVRVGDKVKATYGDLVQFGLSGLGAPAVTCSSLYDGLGNALPLCLSLTISAR